jgi:hypothetical protein
MATLTTAPLVLVDVLTSDGVWGRSYASVYTSLVVEPLARLVENIGNAVVSANAIVPFCSRRCRQVLPYTKGASQLYVY